MTAYKTVRTALHALRRNVMRAVLTTLGIVIGVAAVIAMMEIGNGSSQSMARTIASMGANNLLIMPGTAASGGVSWGSGTTQTLTPDDVDAIEREVPSIRAVSPVVRAPSGQVIYGNKNWVPQQVLGVSPGYLDVREWPMDEGAAFTERDVRNTSKVCIVGKTIVKQLFGDENPLGKEIRVQSITFKIVGVLSAKGANMMGSDQDDVVLAPWTTIKYRVSGQAGSGGASAVASSASSSSNGMNTLNNLYPTNSVAIFPAKDAIQAADMPMPVRFSTVSQIMTAAKSAESIASAMTDITKLLRERHHLRPDELDDFQIRDMTEMSKTFASTSQTMSNLLLAVATISLIVGGIGIMNIMLVSVTERTREIGLRMAVGARSRDILLQFLVEATTLCLIGGLAGILLGVGSSYLVTLFKGWPTVSSPSAIVISVIVSAAVGVSFGFYPAWKASGLDPIEALRYE